MQHKLFVSAAEHQYSSLLGTFERTTLLGVIDAYPGSSGYPILLARFYSPDAEGLDGVFAVKVGSAEWAEEEELLYATLVSSPLTPFLATFKKRSSTIDGLAAVAYDLAFGESEGLDTCSLLSLLSDGDADNVAQGVIADVCRVLASWHLERSSVTGETPRAILGCMLGSKRLADLHMRVSTSVPVWPVSAPNVAIEGRVLPNPLVYVAETAWRRHSLLVPTLKGFVHGDLHTGNIIVGRRPDEDFRIIDFADVQLDGVPFFDFAYLEFDTLLQAMPANDGSGLHRGQWLDFLDTAMTDVLPRTSPLRSQAARAWRLVLPIRRQVQRLTERAFDAKITDASVRNSLGTEFGIVSWWLATVAVGLNFARKAEPRPPVDRLTCLAYAAYGLKRVLSMLNGRQLNVSPRLIPWDWPEETPAYPGLSLDI